MNSIPIQPRGRIIQAIFKTDHYRYTLSLPAGYTGDEPVPLVLVLHYGNHGTPYYGKPILVDMVEPALRELGAVFVSPDCPAGDWTQPVSVEYILDLLEYVQREYRIDLDRVLVTGYSLGGIGTWFLAGRHPERFSAAIVMAGYPPPDITSMDWQVPLYVIQGSEDELFPVDMTTKFITQMKESEADVFYQILDGVTHYESNHYIAPLKSTVPWILKTWEK